jgi:hypothetical protein
MSFREGILIGVTCPFLACGESTGTPMPYVPPRAA